MSKVGSNMRNADISVTKDWCLNQVNNQGFMSMTNMTLTLNSNDFKFLLEESKDAGNFVFHSCPFSTLAISFRKDGMFSEAYIFVDIEKIFKEFVEADFGLISGILDSRLPLTPSVFTVYKVIECYTKILYITGLNKRIGLTIIEDLLAIQPFQIPDYSIKEMKPRFTDIIVANAELGALLKISKLIDNGVL